MSAPVRPYALPRVTSVDANDAIIIDRTGATVRSILFADAVGDLTADVAARLPLAGGTMTGDIVLKGDASADLHPVTKRRFDAATSVPFSSYLPAAFNIASDDAAPYVNTALNDAALDGKTLVFDGRKYQIKTPVTVTRNAARAHFNQTHFLVHDLPIMAQILFNNGADYVGRIGFLFRGLAPVLTGHVIAEGNGVLDSADAVNGTTLAGFVFYKAHLARCYVFIDVRKMSAVRFLKWTDYAEFGNFYGEDIIGRQTFGVGTQGDGEVWVGCFATSRGEGFVKNCHKAGCYFSVAPDATLADITNEACAIGRTMVISETGSLESSGLGARGAKNCRFGEVITSGCVIGLNLQRYNSSSAYPIDGNWFAGVTARTCPTANGTALRIYGDTTAYVGRNVIENVRGSNISGYGITLIRHGVAVIGSIDLDTCTSMFLLQDGRHEIDTIVATNVTSQSYYSDGAAGHIDKVRVLTGLASVVNLIQKLGASANTLSFGSIDVVVNGVGSAPTYLLYDDVSNSKQVRVGTATLNGGQNLCRWTGGFTAYCRNWVMSKNVFMASAASVAAGANATNVTVTWLGIEQADKAEIAMIGATAGNWRLSANIYATGTITVERGNCTGASATILDRNATLTVMHQ